MKKTGFFFLWICLTFQVAIAETCFIVVEKHEEIALELVEKLSGSMINAYIQPIQDIPKAGISEKSCHYAISVSRSNKSLVVGIGGQGHSFGYSSKNGLAGVTQALASAVYKMAKKSAVKKQMCLDYRNELEKECSGKEESGILSYNGRMAFRTRWSDTKPPQTIKVDPRRDSKMLRLPHKLERQIGFLLGKGHYKGAIRLINETLEAMPWHPILFFLKGKANEGIGDSEKAELDFSKACELGLKRACLKVNRRRPPRRGKSTGFRR